MPYPVERLALQRTVRLVASARLRPPVLGKLAGREFLEELAEIEGATSGRLNAQQRGTEAMESGELIVGVPHAHFINAAFSYWRPRELNRFNGPGRGAWYSALEIETSIAEVSFHMERELERVNDFNTAVEYAELFAGFAGEFVDLRDLDPPPECLHPDPSMGYPAGNALADSTRAAGHNGVIYPSARNIGGTCLVALFPHAVQSVTQGDVLRLTWTGEPKPKVERMAKD